MALLTPLLLTTSLILLLTPLLTYLLTSLPSRRSPKPNPQSHHHGSHPPPSPPLTPYLLPYLQHLPSFLRDPTGLMTRTAARFPPNTPFTLLMAGHAFHVFSSRATVAHVFSRSRTFAFEPVLGSMMENALDMDEGDRKTFYQFPGPGQSMKEENRFLQANHAIWLRNLSGDRLERVMEVYSRNLEKYLEEFLEGRKEGEWFGLDYHDFIQRLIFDVSAVTFFGTRLQKYWPDMWQDWKTFNNATYVGVRSGLAYKLNPWAGRARERMIRAFERWVEEGDWKEEDDKEWQTWDEECGYVMNRERERLGRRSGFSRRGRACLHASFLFVIVTNSAPMATWFSFLASHTPSRISAFREAATSCLSPSPSPLDTNTNQLHFNRALLKSHPFLQGLWKEALRLGSASAAARVVMEDNITLEGYSVQRGSVVLLPVALLHHDPEVFPDSHEPKPERWIADPRLDPEEEKARLQRQNLALRSFGGGTGLCSGRFVAEEEVLAVVGMVMLRCDMQWERGTYEFDTRSIGIMGPKGRMMARLRVRERREKSE